MTKKKYRSKSEVNKDNFDKKAMKKHRDEKYRTVFMQATSEYAANREAGIDKNM